MKREFLEETNIVVEPKKIIGIRFNLHDWYVAFSAEYVSGEATSDHNESSEVVWMEIDEALSREDVPDLTKKLIQCALKEDDGFSLVPYEGSTKHGKGYLYGVGFNDSYEGDVAMFCYLVRHGKDDDTVRGGWSNHGLVTEGIQQVNALAKELEKNNLKIDCIYSSDLKRAEETSTIIANVLHVPVVYEPGFREVNNGELAGMKNELANKQYPRLFWSSLDYTECYPSGESPEQFYNRVKSAWLELKTEVLKRGQNIMLVTHGGVIEVILCIENDITFSNKEKHYGVKAAEMVAVEIT